MGTFCSVPLCIYLLSKSPPTIAMRYEGICTFCSEPLCIYPEGYRTESTDTFISYSYCWRGLRKQVNTERFRTESTDTFISYSYCWRRFREQVNLLSQSPPTIAIRYKGMGTFCSVPLCIYLLSKSPPTIAMRYEGICTFCSVPLCIYLLSKSPPTIAMRYEGHKFRIRDGQ
jgi:hypothetical protein